ncbi:MAG TPA: alpha/beta fold hydrolase [Chitinophagaceae bacterium]|nr:alpha/beta fold hydrolase [Chitinophagaceae bacterium]
MIRSCPFLFSSLPVMKINYKKVWKWVKILSIVYVLGGVALYFLQDYVLFHPVTLKRDHNYNFPEKYKDINIPITENSNLNIVQFFSTDTITKGVVLYFHGNKKNISWYAKYAPYFTKHGYEVWLIDYPGFGKSTGKLTERTLYDWANYMYKFARTRFSADSIIIYGKSMGTGIATHLASIKPCKKLILETPYYDYPSVIRHYIPIYPIEWMIHYKIPTHDYIEKVIVPITIFQGTDDRLVTYNNAIRLKPFLKAGDEFVTIDGGSHNDLYDFKETIEKLDYLLKD